jgi:hypothetical protein
MFNINTTALYAAIIASVLVASLFAISYVQQHALAQGNQTGEQLLVLIRVEVTQLAAAQPPVVPQLALAAVLLISGL